MKKYITFNTKNKRFQVFEQNEVIIKFGCDSFYERFFLKEEDIILLPNAKIVVCTQWGIFNIIKFIKQAKSLGFIIETI